MTAGADSSGVCLKCGAGTYFQVGQSTCLPCLEGKYATEQGTMLPAACTPIITSSTGTNLAIHIVVTIFQFKALYPMSDITEEIQNKMTIAIAKLLEFNASSVLLNFAPVNLRREVHSRTLPEGTLVTVGLVNFQGSAAQFAPLIDQQRIDSEMATEGLMSVELLPFANGTSAPESIVFANGTSAPEGIVLPSKNL